MFWRGGSEGRLAKGFAPRHQELNVIGHKAEHRLGIAGLASRHPLGNEVANCPFILIHAPSRQRRPEPSTAKRSATPSTLLWRHGAGPSRPRSVPLPVLGPGLWPTPLSNHCPDFWSRFLARSSLARLSASACNAQARELFAAQSPNNRRASSLAPADGPRAPPPGRPSREQPPRVGACSSRLAVSGRGTSRRECRPSWSRPQR
mgnify:CR=1 FL=1